MKKIIAIITIILLGLILTSCKKDVESQYDPDYKYSEDEVKDLTIGIEDIKDIRNLWKPDNYESLSDADKLKEKEKADYIVYFYTGWCYYCNEIKEDVLELIKEIDSPSNKVFLFNRDSLYAIPEFTKNEDGSFKSSYSHYEGLDETGIYNANFAILKDSMNQFTVTELQVTDSIGTPNAFRFAYTEATTVAIQDNKSGAGDTGATALFESYVCSYVGADADSETCKKK